MKKKTMNLLTNMIRVRKNETAHYIYDVELENIDRLKEYHSFECHIVLYPYSRKINSKDFEFMPFEEYVNDLAMNQKSAYVKIKNSFCKLFGLLLGIIITIVFYLFKPEDLFSVESIVSIFGAYLVGKEIWEDIDSFMVDISKTWYIRFQDPYYYYRLEKNSTLSVYSHLAKKRRYGKSAILPEKMDFMEKSNSQTMRLFFNMKEFKNLKETAAHILSIRMAPELVAEFENEGFLLGVKLSFNKRFMGIRRCFEVFQSIDKDQKGSLDEKGEWANGALFYRQALTWGRLKWVLKKGWEKGKSIMEIV